MKSCYFGLLRFPLLLQLLPVKSAVITARTLWGGALLRSATGGATNPRETWRASYMSDLSEGGTGVQHKG